MRQTLFGANGRDDLGFGVEVHVEEFLVALGHCETQVRNSATRAVAMVTWIACRFGQLLHRDLRTWKVWISKAEVDCVTPVGASCGFEAIDLSEHVGRQPIDASEFHQ